MKSFAKNVLYLHRQIKCRDLNISQSRKVFFDERAY